MRYLILLILLIGCASQQDQSKPTQPTNPTQDTSTEIKLGKKLTLWSTYYYVPEYSSSAFGIPARDQYGKPLGPKLPLKEMCNLQLQGSGTIDGQMYGYWKKTNAHKVNCSSVSSKIPGTVKFRKENTKYGTGVKLWPLTPFKSIAVDPRHIAYGSKLFIPKLKGIKYTLEGKEYVHDGIVIAQDTGGAIKGNHIDFFIGPVKGGFKNTLPIARPFFGFVKSKKSGTFTAYLIQ